MIADEIRTELRRIDPDRLEVGASLDDDQREAAMRIFKFGLRRAFLKALDGVPIDRDTAEQAEASIAELAEMAFADHRRLH